jgi:hypothetical protein
MRTVGAKGYQGALRSCGIIAAYGRRTLNTDKHHSEHPGYQMKTDVLNQNSLIIYARKLNKEATWKNPIQNESWDLQDVENVIETHKPVNGIVDRLAYGGVRTLRLLFDVFSGYRFGPKTEKKILMRCCFLETVAGVPGMVAGMLRHMTSLRRMKRDHGWIHTLLEEAENERMHLLTFLELKKPSIVFRCTVLVAQGIFFNLFFLCYLVSPRFCHRFVGYLEEEAVHTYTTIIKEIDKGTVFKGAKAPAVAINYWNLPVDASIRHLMVVVRADEAGHKLVNHTFADMHQEGLRDGSNPFRVLHSEP